mgnify:CR=1 FL=1
MKKIISIMSMLILTCSLIGCTAEKQSEDNMKEGFKLNVDVDEFVSRQERELQEYSKINDLSIKVDDEKKLIIINVPVDISGNINSIRKMIIDDQTKLDMINNLFNKAVSTFDFCNPIANYKIDLNIINKSNEESVLEIISDKEITTTDIQKMLKKDTKDTDKNNIVNNNTKKQSKKNDTKETSTDNSEEYYDNTRYDSGEVLARVQQKIDSTLNKYYESSELTMKNNIVGVHLYPSMYLKGLDDEGKPVYKCYDISYDYIGKWLSDEFGYDVKYFVVVIDDSEEVYNNSNY